MADCAELEKMLQQIDAEKNAAQTDLYALEQRVKKLAKAADGIRALLEAGLPDSGELPGSDLA